MIGLNNFICNFHLDMNVRSSLAVHEMESGFFSNQRLSQIMSFRTSSSMSTNQWNPASPTNGGYRFFSLTVDIRSTSSYVTKNKACSIPRLCLYVARSKSVCHLLVACEFFEKHNSTISPDGGSPWSGWMICHFSMLQDIMSDNVTKARMFPHARWPPSGDNTAFLAGARGA